jgi:hypothetical protein
MPPMHGLCIDRLEFGVLSRLTGDRRFEMAARRALIALYDARSSKDLFGAHINVNTRTLSES